MAAIICVSLIESATRPRVCVEAPLKDCAKNKAPNEPANFTFSASDYAGWVKKGRKITLGYKGFAR